MTNMKINMENLKKICFKADTFKNMSDDAINTLKYIVTLKELSKLGDLVYENLDTLVYLEKKLKQDGHCKPLTKLLNEENETSKYLCNIYNDLNSVLSDLEKEKMNSKITKIIIVLEDNSQQIFSTRDLP